MRCSGRDELIGAKVHAHAPALAAGTARSAAHLPADGAQDKKDGCSSFLWCACRPGTHCHLTQLAQGGY